MSRMDKIKHSLQSARGKAKQVGGAATGDVSAEDSGRREQASADFKAAGERMKESGAKLRNAFKH